MKQTSRLTVVYLPFERLDSSSSDCKSLRMREIGIQLIRIRQSFKCLALSVEEVEVELCLNPRTLVPEGPLILDVGCDRSGSI